jgi:hypothetical protein
MAFLSKSFTFQQLTHHHLTWELFIFLFVIVFLLLEDENSYLVCSVLHL